MGMEGNVTGIDAMQDPLREAAGMAVLSRSLSQSEQEAAALLKILESVPPLPEGSGATIDILA
jgi:hypothetical protein